MIQSVWKNLTGLQKAAEHLWCNFKWAKRNALGTPEYRHGPTERELYVCLSRLNSVTLDKQRPSSYHMCSDMIFSAHM